MKIGIDIGGSHIASGIVENGKILDKEQKDFDLLNKENEKRAQNFILETIKNQISSLLSRNEGKIEKIGLGVPGNPTKTSIVNVVNLGISKFEIAPLLEELFCAKINIRNDGKCAGLAEKEYGAMKGYKDAIFLCLGTGVGSAVFLNDKLLEPTQNNGFELGHVIIDKNGRKCNCGKNGCFETYASMKRMKKDAIEKLNLPKDSLSEEVQMYIRENINKRQVKDFVEEYISNLAIGISNYINIFEPGVICIGGSFVYYEDIFIPMLTDKIRNSNLLFNKDTKFVIVPAKLGNEAGIIGASI